MWRSVCRFVGDVRSAYREAKVQVFLQACEDGNMKKVKELINHVDINCCDAYGTTGLMFAVTSGNPCALSIVTRLLSHGADVGKENLDQFDAIDSVLLTVPFQPQVAELLLKHSKPGINKIDSDGFSYLTSCESLDALRFCVENGANISYLILGKETILDRINRILQMTNSRLNKLNRNPYPHNISTYIDQRNYLISLT